MICSDGDLQEGVASEASSLAGHLRLGKLIALYDDNRIQLDGPTAWAFTEDVARAVRRVRLAHPAGRGRQRRRGDRRAPSTPPRRTTGRRSSPSGRTSATARPNKQDTQKAHGAPLGPDEVRLTKEAYGWDPDKTFFVPDEARGAVPPGGRPGPEAGRGLGVARSTAYADAFPAEAAELKRRRRRPARRRLGRRPPDLRDRHRGRDPQREPGRDPGAGRAGAGAVRRLGGPVRVQPDRRQGERPRPLRGRPPGAQPAVRRPRARHGRRSSTASTYHGGFLPYGATFLTFSDYMRGAVRLAALSELHVIYVWTHDSVGLGEDGPTHQPVEHYAALRAIPNLWFVRPGDANETVGRVGARGGAAGDRRRAVGPGGARADAPEAADAAGHEGAGARGRAARRLRAARGGRRRDRRS